MTRVFSYAPDRLLSELSVRLYEKEIYLGSVLVRFGDRDGSCEINSIYFGASRVGALVSFSARLEIDCAVRVAENLARKVITIEQLNNSSLVGELFD